MKRTAALLKLAFGLCCLAGGALLFLGCAVISCAVQLAPPADGSGAATLAFLARLALMGLPAALLGFLITLASWPRDRQA